MNKNWVQSDTAKQNTDDEILGSENDLSLGLFLQTRSKVIKSLRKRGLHLSAEEFRELDIGNTDKN